MARWFWRQWNFSWRQRSRDYRMRRLQQRIGQLSMPIDCLHVPWDKQKVERAWTAWETGWKCADFADPHSNQKSRQSIVRTTVLYLTTRSSRTCKNSNIWMSLSSNSMRFLNWSVTKKIHSLAVARKCGAQLAHENLLRWFIQVRYRLREDSYLLQVQEQIVALSLRNVHEN